MELGRTNGYDVGNVEVTVMAQKPKLSPYIQEMRRTLADTMNVAVDQVSVKATTTERLGFEGREEGISASAVCLLHN